MRKKKNSPEDSGQIKAPTRKSAGGVAAALFGIAFSTLWLLNLTFGLLEIPDNLPIIGNLDEVFFTMVLMGSLAYLGIEIPFLTKYFTARK